MWNEKISEHKLVFEIFGTVLLTDYTSSNDLYFLMDDFFRELTQSDIIFHRIMQELGEGAFDQKYEMLMMLGMDKSTILELKEKEQELILKYTYPRKWFCIEYKKLKESGKEILFVNNSDLADEFVIKIFEKYGIDDAVIVEEEERDVIRINSIVSDIGYGNSLLKVAAGNLINYEAMIDSVGYRWIYRMVANTVYDNPFYEFIHGTVTNRSPYIVGYSLMGVHILGIIKWIFEQVNKLEPSKILFCSRDCYLIIQAYEKLREIYPSLPEARYIQASRKLLLPSFYREKRDFYQLPDSYLFFSPRSVIMLFWPFNKLAGEGQANHVDFLKYDEYFKRILEESGFNYTNNFSSYKTYIIFIDWFWNNFYCKEKHDKCLHLLEEYFSDICDGDAVMDLGYSGRIPNEIAKLCGFSLNVLYIMGDEETVEMLTRRNQIHVKTFYPNVMASNNVFREYLISEPTPSCVGLRWDNGQLFPIFETDIDKFYVSDGLKQLQQGAMDFVDDILNKMGNDLMKIPFKPQEISLPWEGYLRDIPKADLEMYKEFYQEDYHTGERAVVSWFERYQIENSGLPNVVAEESKICRKVKTLMQNSRKLAYFGAGKKCCEFLQTYKELLPEVVIDNNVTKLKQSVLNIPISRADKISTWEDYFIVITIKNYSTVKEQLESYGLIEGKNFIWYNDLVG